MFEISARYTPPGPADPRAPIVLFLHGVVGHARANYVLRAVRRGVKRRGASTAEAARLEARGCSSPSLAVSVMEFQVVGWFHF